MRDGGRGGGEIVPDVGAKVWEMGEGGEGRLFQMWGPKCERRWGVGEGGEIIPDVGAKVWEMGGEGGLFQMWGPVCERDGEGGGGDCSRCGGQSVRDGEGGGGRDCSRCGSQSVREGEGSKVAASRDLELLVVVVLVVSIDNSVFGRWQCIWLVTVSVTRCLTSFHEPLLSPRSRLFNLY